MELAIQRWHARLSTTNARLRPGCSPAEIEAATLTLKRPLPIDLAALYRAADGQIDRDLFRGDLRMGPAKQLVWDANEGSSRFLVLSEAVALSQTLLADTEQDVFDHTLIPFASDGSWLVFCVHVETAEVVLLWTGGPDWTLPVDWQTLRRVVAPDLFAFFDLAVRPKTPIPR